MTIKQARADITKTIEALYKDGVIVRAIVVTWTSDVELDEKKAVPEATIRCGITIEADL